MLENISGLPPLAQILNEANTEPVRKNAPQKTSNNLQTELNVEKKDNVKKAEEKQELQSSNQVDYTGLQEKINSVLKDDNLAIEFSLDSDTKKMIMKIIDSETQEIIHQFPPEIALKIARIVANTLESGNLTNAKI